MDTFEGYAKRDPVLIREIDLETPMTFNIWVNNQAKVIQNCPELLSSGCYGRDDLPNAQITKEAWQCDRCFFKVAAPQLHKIRGLIACGGAIDHRVYVGSEGQKRKIGNGQIKFITQARNDSFVGEVRFFEHYFLELVRRLLRSFPPTLRAR